VPPTFLAPVLLFLSPCSANSHPVLSEAVLVLDPGSLDETQQPEGSAHFSRPRLETLVVVGHFDYDYDHQQSVGLPLGDGVGEPLSCPDDPFWGGVQPGDAG